MTHLVENNGLGVDLVERGGCGPRVMKTIECDIRLGDRTVVKEKW